MRIEKAILTSCCCKSSFLWGLPALSVATASKAQANTARVDAIVREDLIFQQIKTKSTSTGRGVEYPGLCLRPRER